MRPLSQGLCLALLGAGFAAVPVIQAAAAGSAPNVAPENLVQQMRSEAQGGVKISAESATGKVGFIRAPGNGDLMPDRKADSRDGAVAKATAYLDEFGAAFGAPAGQLRQAGVNAGQTGWTVSYTQEYQGVPVFGSMLRAHIDRAGDLTSVNGYAAPGLDLSVTPRISKTDAAVRAIATVRAEPPGDGATDTSGLKAGSNELAVYRMGAVKGEPGPAVLAYVVEVTNEANVRDMVFVDATTNKVVNRYSMVHDALDRELYEAFVDDGSVGFELVWEEGDPLPGDLNEDQQNLVNTGGDAYWFFQNTFGRDSYDDAGATMRTVNNDPRISCPNANWNGATTNYCNGVTSDDVVAHEWGHAYTEYTSGLIYQWQSGALNESYSDVWGETVDLINGRDDEGETDTVRTVDSCSAHSPPSPLLTINSPSEIAKDCVTGGYLGPDPLTPVTADVVAPTDPAEPEGDGLPAGTTTDGCSEYDDPNIADGKVVMVDRGRCTFVSKAEIAQDAGAVAVIIGNGDNAPVGFSSPDQTLPPTVSIGLDDRELIRATLAGGDPVNASITDESGAREDSHRWLVAEKSEAFGGAIRDMWNPTCHGDPGKVSDAEYTCSTDDAGGVHSNSGVPNHAYSLLVDGGTYNGVTVPGIGLDRAAHVYWETQANYLTPSSDFADFANGLDASCASLVGQEITALSTQPDTPGEPITPITTADCAAVAAASVATELRKEPTQCEFQPLLAKDAPAICGEDSQTKVVWKENFQDGMAGWTKGEKVVYPGADGIDWRTTAYPPERQSRVAYAPDPTEAGDCSGTASDVSSRNSILSPLIRMPGKGVRMPRLTFDHYVATEHGYDGGNVKYKVNGGPLKIVPADAFVFNTYNDAMTSAGAGNSSPLAGQDGFTGTDGGEVSGSWGQSQISLGMLGVGKGDNFKIRFDFGRDGCGGNDGWYVDDVTVATCKRTNDAKATKP